MGWFAKKADGKRTAVVEPLTVTSGVDGTYVSHSPPIEIVSPESVDRDYIKKRQQYEQAGVGEYWIIDELKSLVKLLRLGDDAQYKEVKPRKGVLMSTTIAGFWLRTAWLWQTELPDPDDVLHEILAGPPAYRPATDAATPRNSRPNPILVASTPNNTKWNT